MNSFFVSSSSVNLPNCTSLLGNLVLYGLVLVNLFQDKLLLFIADLDVIEGVAEDNAELRGAFHGEGFHVCCLCRAITKTGDVCRVKQSSKHHLAIIHEASIYEPSSYSKRRKVSSSLKLCRRKACAEGDCVDNIVTASSSL